VNRPVNDSEAVQRLREGDEQALVTLYDRYAQRLYRFTLDKLDRPEDAEEVVTDTFLRVFRHVRECRDEESFSGWLFTIARNLCRERLRRPRRFRVVSLDQLQEEEIEPAAPSTTEQVPLNLLVQQALAQLPADYRLVLSMREMDELTNTETAQALGRSPAATKSLHWRARQALRDALEEILGRSE
jgi:RNA polymerase sigma-70 factor, ECF subfamily